MLGVVICLLLVVIALLICPKLIKNIKSRNSNTPHELGNLTPRKDVVDFDKIVDIECSKP